MPPYQVVDIRLSWALALGHAALTWHFSVFNVFNEKYEILRDMPMPLREWRAGLTISFTPSTRDYAAVPAVNRSGRRP
jgi:outer membrane receptor protein involved in Fe transport